MSDFPRLTPTQNRLLARAPDAFQPLPEDVRPFNRTLLALERKGAVDILKKSDGTLHWAAYRGKWVFNENGDPVRDDGIENNEGGNDR